MSRFILAMLFILFSANVLPANLVKVELNDETYMVVSVRLSNKIKLVEGVEVFIHEGKNMLPLYAFTNSLGMGVSINNEKGEFSLDFNNNKTDINFPNKVIESTLDISNDDVFWADDGFDIYVNQAFLESLINAEINAKISNLIFEIKSLNKNLLYPIELKLQREADIDNRIFKPNIKRKVNLGNVFIEDQYRLIMPPNLYVRLRNNINEVSSTSLSEPGEKTYESSTTAAITGTSDLLYHSSRYSINWEEGGGTQSTINFSKYKTSPYDVLPGNVDYYSFGDVRGYASSLTGATGGAGLTFSQKDDRYSNEFGQTNIDGIASPGWQVELYDGGYFIGETIVNDDGQFIFTEVNTRYGVNQYRIVLYGPYGEVETRYETIRIGTNWLNEGEISYRGAILDSNKRLLNSSQSSSGYEIDTVNFGFDYGLNNSTQLQLMFNQNEDLNGTLQRYLSTQAQVNFSNKSLTFGVATQDDFGFVTEVELLGRTGNLDSYGLNLQYLNDYNLYADGDGSSIVDLSGNYHSEFNIWGKNSFDFYSQSSFSDEQYESFYNRLRVSWPFINISMRFELQNRRYHSFLDNDVDSNISYAVLSATGSVGGGRVTLLTNQQIEGGDNQEYNLTYQTQYDSLVLYTNTNYTKTSLGSSEWGAGVQAAYRTRHAFVNSSINYHTQSKWQLSLGVDFSFSYDYQNNKLNFSSSYNQTAMLDIGVFLDRNNNTVLDSGDYALEGVEFGSLSSWAESPSLANGRALLTSVPVKNVVTVNAKWRDVVRPSQGSHSLYTHPGGLVSVNIPFTITTSVAGYVLFDGGDELQGANSVRVNLIDVNTKQLVETAIADEDGYFEFYNKNAGHYFIELVSDDVLKRGLTASHMRFDFKTPSRGGYVELDPFILESGTEQNDKTLLVEFNSDNYEPLFSGEGKDREIYVTPPSSESSKLNSTVRNNNMRMGSIKRTSIKLTPDIPIEPLIVKAQQNVNNIGDNEGVTSLTGTTVTAAVNGSNASTASPLVIEAERDSIEKESFTRLEWRYGAQIAVFSSEASADAYIDSLDLKNIPVKAYFDEDNQLFRLILGELTGNVGDVEMNIAKYKAALPDRDMFAKYFRVLISY